MRPAPAAETGFAVETGAEVGRPGRAAKKEQETAGVENRPGRDGPARFFHDAAGIRARTPDSRRRAGTAPQGGSLNVFSRLLGRRERKGAPPEGELSSKNLAEWMATLEDDDLQARMDPHVIRKQAAGGLAVDQLPGAQGEFGRNPDNPIPVNGMLGELVYLSMLRTRDTDRRLYYHLLGVGWSEALEQPVSAYETVSADGRMWDILYTSVLHPRKTRLAPDGYVTVDPRELRGVLYGESRCIENFPQGMDGVIAECMERQLDAPQASLRRELAKGLEGVRFKRPQAHRKKLKQVAQQVLSPDLAVKESGALSPEEKEKEMEDLAEVGIEHVEVMADMLKLTDVEEAPPELERARRSLVELVILAKNERLQNERSDAEARDRIVNGPDVDELPEARGEFGRDPDNPIPVNGAFGEQLYLSLLTTEGAGRELFHHRLGQKTGRLGPVAVHETVSVDGERWDILYFSTSHPRRSRKTPAGYAFAEGKDAATALPMRGSGRRVKNFPHGVRAQVSKTLKEISGLDFPLPMGRLADPAVRFRRPPEHRKRLKAVTDGLADPRGGAGEAVR